MSKVHNPFRNPAHRAAFDECVRSYLARAGGIRRRDGSRCLGNSIAGAFWRGYDGFKGEGHFITRADRETFGYVAWRAGQLTAQAAV